MRGPKPKYSIQLNEQQYKDLKHLSQSYMAPWVEVQRARILLLAHERSEWSNYHIAKTVGCHVEMVKKCRRCWHEKPSIKSAARSGAPRKFTAMQRSQIVALACSQPSDHSKPWKRWSTTKLAQVAVENEIVDSISPTTIGRWLHHDHIKPWHYHSWQQPTDPQFVEKAAPVLDLYEKADDLTEKEEVVICIDEKTSIQARRPLTETRPAIPDHPVQICDRYERKGALQLFCALIVATGMTLVQCFESKRFCDFQNFLLQLFASALCKGLKVLHLIMDNGSTHAPKQIENWIASLCLYFEVKIYWLPKHASWLDQVEIVFSKVQRHLLTPCYFDDKASLKSDIMAYFDDLNQNPKPIKWTYTKNTMLTKFSNPFT